MVFYFSNVISFLFDHPLFPRNKVLVEINFNIGLRFCRQNTLPNNLLAEWQIFAFPCCNKQSFYVTKIKCRMVFDMPFWPCKIWSLFTHHLDFGISGRHWFSECFVCTATKMKIFVIFFFFLKTLIFQSNLNGLSSSFL